MPADNTRLTPIKLDDNTIIYIQAQENINQVEITDTNT